MDCFQKVVLLTSIFLISFPSSVFAHESLVGIWQKPGNSVYIEFYSDGSAFQCRLDGPPNRLYKFTATGKMVAESQVEWGIVVATLNGNPFELQELPKNFSWGVDELNFHSDGSLRLFSNLIGIEIELSRIRKMPEECIDAQKSDLS